LSGAWFGRATAALIVHPALWGTALLQLFRLAPTGWWRRWPPVPAPDPDYLRFRLQTAYGDPNREPEPADVVTYLEWCRRTRTLSR
jgi:hypothetical protein